MDEQLIFMKDKTIEDFWEQCKEELAGESKIFAIVNYPEECIERMNLCQVISLFDVEIMGLVFDKDLLVKTGYYNDSLQDHREYELLCRLVEECGDCVVIGVPYQDGDTLTEQTALTDSYVLRRYMPVLKEQGLLDGYFGAILEAYMVAGFGENFKRNMNTLLTNEEEYGKLYRRTAPYIVLRGDDLCAGVLQGFADEIARSLIGAGEAVSVWSNEEVSMEGLEYGSKGIIGIQAPILYSDIVRNMKGRKYQIWLDYPAPFGKYFLNNPEEYYVLCQDGNHVEFLKRFFGQTRAVHFPMGGIDRGYYQQKDRPYDISFIGSYYNPYPDFESDFQKQYYEYMLQHTKMTFEAGLDNMLQERAIEMKDEEKLQLLISLRPIYRSILGHFRKKVIDAILEAGYKLHVYSDGWKDYDGPGKDNLVIHPEVSYEDSIAEFGKTKIALNVMSWHKDGMTERISNILLSGAVCLTEETSYLCSHFDATEVCMFSLEEIERIPELVRELLENTQKREEMIRRAYEKAVKQYTWDARVEQLIEIGAKHVTV